MTAAEALLAAEAELRKASAVAEGHPSRENIERVQAHMALADRWMQLAERLP